jgi:putative GTP pyrophosphokinase
MPDVSKTQINRLGERLKKGEVSDEDLRLLDDYRRSFSYAYDTVVSKIRDDLGLEPTGRPAKSTSSIAEKLRRETIRLTQIQDIAGCRVVVPNIDEQEELAKNLTVLFGATLVDRRKTPSHGYRAVHAIATVFDKTIEIQIRTILQHMWAELSEKLADKQGQELK